MDEETHATAGNEVIIEPPCCAIITFSLKEKWIMKLTEEGIKFNIADFPHAEPKFFAEKVIEILERNFSVKFTDDFPKAF